MNESDQDKLNRHREKVLNELGEPEFFDSFTLETLNNFAFRYFDDAHPAEKIQHRPHRYVVRAREMGIKQAIKISSPLLREKLKQLVLSYPPLEVTLERRFQVEFEDAKQGQVLVSAALSYGHPDHEYSRDTYIEKTMTFEFSEFLLLRNRLASLLENVAQLYD